MDGKVLDYLMHRADSRRMRRDYADEADYNDSRRRSDYGDERRGVKGTGRGRRDYNDYEDERRDYADYDERRDYGEADNRRNRRDMNDHDERDYRDGGMPKLTKTDMNDWKRMLENMDGSRGAHYDMQQIMHAAEKAGVKFDEYDEKEYCLVVNWLYSDYCRAIKKHVSSDEILALCADMAKDFFDDPDGPDPRLKLALLYHCVINA